MEILVLEEEMRFSELLGWVCRTLSHRDPTHLKKQHGELSEGDNECPPTPSTCTCVSVHGQKARASTQTHICNLEKSHLSDTQAKLRLLRNNEYTCIMKWGNDLYIRYTRFWFVYALTESNKNALLEDWSSWW